VAVSTLAVIAAPYWRTVLPDDRPDVGSEHDKGEFPARQVLLIPDILIGRNHHVEFRLLRYFEKLAVLELQEDPVRRAELNDWLTLTLRPAFAGRILPVTEDILLKWRVLMEDGRKIGHTYSHPDLLLAATALQHGLTVVTRDRSHFDMALAPVLNPWETT
jgi:predicted nucleic acid-binding protein